MPYKDREIAKAKAKESYANNKRHEELCKAFISNRERGILDLQSTEQEVSLTDVAIYIEKQKKRNEYAKEWRKNNHEKCKIYNKTSKAKRVEQDRERWRVYYSINSKKCNAATVLSRQNRTPEQKEFYLQKRREYYSANKEKINKVARENLIKNPNAKLARTLRSRLRDFLKKGYKGGSAVAELGCTLEELRLHMESLFKEGMSWENHGSFGWHIDHVLPLSSFNLSDKEDFKKACHWTNLQPLWWQDNIKKTNKILS